MQPYLSAGLRFERGGWRMENINLPIQSGQKYTLYQCGESAITHRDEIIVASVSSVPIFTPDFQGSTRGKYRFGTFKRFRKRGEFHLDLRLQKTLVIPGWDHLFVDHEAFGNFQCSATINIAADVEKVRKLVEMNINRHFTAHDTIVAFPLPWNEMPDNEGIPVFPDAPTHHAVIERLRNSTASAQ
ncbi:MAG: hypothetical protein QM627_12275 [Luteolibacter sp.]